MNRVVRFLYWTPQEARDEILKNPWKILQIPVLRGGHKNPRNPENHEMISLKTTPGSKPPPFGALSHADKF